MKKTTVKIDGDDDYCPKVCPFYHSNGQNGCTNPLLDSSTIRQGRRIKQCKQFAGNYMYMRSKGRIDFFKHINTRKYRQNDSNN